jgi:hypothetical protein
MLQVSPILLPSLNHTNSIRWKYKQEAPRYLTIFILLFLYITEYLMGFMWKVLVADVGYWYRDIEMLGCGAVIFTVQRDGHLVVVHVYVNISWQCLARGTLSQCA